MDIVIKKLFITAGVVAMGVVAVKSGIVDTLADTVSAYTRQFQANQRSGPSPDVDVVEVIKHRQRCTKQTLDEIGFDGPDRRSAEERRAALSACDGLTF